MTGGRLHRSRRDTSCSKSAFCDALLSVACSFRNRLCYSCLCHLSLSPASFLIQLIQSLSVTRDGKEEGDVLSPPLFVIFYLPSTFGSSSSLFSESCHRVEVRALILVLRPSLLRIRHCDDFPSHLAAKHNEPPSSLICVWYGHQNGNGRSLLVQEGKTQVAEEAIQSSEFLREVSSSPLPVVLRKSTESQIKGRQKEEMGAEPLAAASWLSLVGGINHLVASALRAPWRKRGDRGGEKVVIGVLAFEAGGLISKILHLWNSLSDKQVMTLRDQIIASEGVQKLVSENEDYLLGLACEEMIDNLRLVVQSISRLGKKCSDVALQGFEHVFDDLVKNNLHLCNWEYSLKKMERKVKKMEHLVSLTANLYHELEVLSELEQGLRRTMTSGIDHPTRRGTLNLVECQQKVAWHRQEVKYLRENSLWNRTYDVIVKFLARSTVTIFSKMRRVFGIHNPMVIRKTENPRFSAGGLLPRTLSVSQFPDFSSEINWTRFSSGPLGKVVARSGPLPCSRKDIVEHHRHHRGCSSHQLNGGHLMNPATMTSSGPLIRGCIAGRIDTLSLANDYDRAGACNPDGFEESRVGYGNKCVSVFSSKCKLLIPLSSTLGAAALALHYANVIILIEKLAETPPLIGTDARSDLYAMLPNSVRVSLRARLKSYNSKELAMSVSDPSLAAEWRDALARILRWLAPLAHNMIRWQSERSFEQQHMCSCTTTSILLLQTLYFADQEKTEAAITELLVGLNYLWRYERELNAKALLECTSNGCFDDPVDLKA